MIKRVEDMLEREGVRWETIRHPVAFTAQERAAACHLTGHALAKVVVVCDDTDNWFALGVLPATAYVDLIALRQRLGRPHLRLARETEFAELFPDCDVGGMPPFGRLYGGLDVFIDPALATGSTLVCECGAHDEELKIPMRDYLRVEHPEVFPLASRRAA